MKRLSVYSFGARGYSQKNNISLAHGTVKTVATAILPYGTWLCNFHVVFSSHASSYRFISLSPTSDTLDAAYEKMTGVQLQAISGARTMIGTSAILISTNKNESRTVYGIAQQGSGTTLTLDSFMEWVKISVNPG